MERIHDEEVDTSERVLRTLLAEQCPRWSTLPARRMDTTGTSNTLWRLHTSFDEPDVVVRLPRQLGADGDIAVELNALPALRSSSLTDRVAVPEVVHAGWPSEAYPMTWMACAWIEGRDLWAARDEAVADVELAVSLADAVQTLGGLRGWPAVPRTSDQRGGPLAGVVARLRGWLDDPRWRADRLVDVTAIRRLADEADDLVGLPFSAVVVHGDLIPGNLLLDRSDRLSAIIDWGGVGLGDPAQDLAPAWAIFDGTARAAFREALAVDDEAWARGRITELEHAVGGVLYYQPRGHPLGDVMAVTLERILRDT